jgi:bifunctional DNA-binding transcriptional regulator/antitoxin component of YhaV-PrlF toxin-antitoxin module
MQRGGRFQVPKLIRWEFKLESTQFLDVSVRFDGSWRTLQRFFAQMRKDGRITIPKLVQQLLAASF